MKAGDVAGEAVPQGAWAIAMAVMAILAAWFTGGINALDAFRFMLMWPLLHLGAAAFTDAHRFDMSADPKAEREKAGGAEPLDLQVTSVFMYAIGCFNAFWLGAEILFVATCYMVLSMMFSESIQHSKKGRAVAANVRLIVRVAGPIASGLLFGLLGLGGHISNIMIS